MGSTAHMYALNFKSEESMISFNTSNAEIIAIGNILKLNIHVLTYNIQGRVRDMIWTLYTFFLKAGNKYLTAGNTSYA